MGRRFSPVLFALVALVPLFASAFACSGADGVGLGLGDAAPSTDPTGDDGSRPDATGVPPPPPADAGDASRDATSDAASSLCAPVATTCGPLADGGSPCCDGTNCQTDYGWVHCVHDKGGSCKSDADCGVGWSCTADGTCGYPPKCAATSEACGPDRPEITTGCCDARETCYSAVYPSRCCRASGAVCATDGDCCPGLGCGPGHTCVAPTCAPLGDTLVCSLYPGIGCCDARLACQPIDPLAPGTKHCCAPPGTVLTPADGAICCSGGVFTGPDGIMTCAKPH